MSHVEPASSPGLALMVYAQETTQYLTVVATTILVWDMIVTLDIEIQRVWFAKKTFGTSLFFFNRYVPPTVLLYDVYYVFLPSPSLEFCKNFELSYALVGLLSIGSIACVLIMRTNALYQSRFLFVALISLGILAIANMIVCFLIVFNLTNFTPKKPVGFSGCYSKCTSPICQKVLTIFWVPFFLFETIIFVLTMRKYTQEYRRTQAPNRSNVLAVVMRDGLIYYIVIMAICIVNVIMWLFAEPSQAFFFLALWKSLQSTICSRIMLNLRGLLEATRGRTRIQTDSPGTLLHLTLIQSSINSGNELADEHEQEEQDLDIEEVLR
jgi:hypothetical protein